MQKPFLLICALTFSLLAFGAASTTTSSAADETVSASREQTTAAAHDAAIRWLGARVSAYQRATWQWQRLMGEPLIKTPGRTLTGMTVADIRQAVRLWRDRAAAARRRAQNPPDLRAWLCVHRYEGSWSDDGAPYYGGLQMDLRFQQSYGGRLLETKGTANHWTPLEQIWVAERARRSGRGFSPWANSARSCGLF
ncbi:MAG: hypothetical protein ABR569_14480 [Gaiellaceae bacterium]